jgi:hypothetical protein
MPTIRLRIGVATAAVAFLFVVAARDWWMHPENPRRAKEYGFLLYAMLVSIAYGVAHDHVTATISPEYFLWWKGLAEDPRPFRWAVTLLAVRASFGAGLIGGAVLLIANNPRASGGPPQLCYRELVALSLLPLGLAAVFGATWGGVNAFARVGAATAREFVAPERLQAFVAVWAIHAGSYAGGLVGVIVGAVVVVRRRRRLRTMRR